VDSLDTGWFMQNVIFGTIIDRPEDHDAGKDVPYMSNVDERKTGKCIQQ